MSSPILLEKTVLDTLNLPVLAVDREGTLHYGNAAAGYRWHFLPENLKGLTAERIFGSESPICTHLRRAVAEDSSFTLEPLRLKNRGGRTQQLLRVQIDPVSVPGKAPALAVAIFLDLTQWERLENRVAEHKRMDAIALMVKGLAHELQNPLSGVKGATQLLDRKLAERSDLREYSTVVLREIERLERLVKNLLLQGGEQALDKAMFNLHELLDTVIWFQTNAVSGGEVVREYDPSLPDLLADRDKLHQVFLNLVQNAMVACKGKHPVIVRTKFLGAWQERENLPPAEGNFFQIEVEDRGVGVAPEHREHLFTPFFTTKTSGTGLGLAIAYRIVQAHQGYLDYRPAPAGKGAIFSVTLPLQGNPGKHE